jgi:hypothetical protein
MKNLRNAAILAIAALTGVLACTKEDQNSGNSWGNTISGSSNVSLLMNELAMPLYRQTVNVQNFGQLELKFPDGLKVNITLPLRDANGNIVTGNIIVEEILLRKNGDFIRQNRPTQTINAMLVTGGSFYLNLSQNGKDLAASYSFTLPQQDANFELFNGVANGPSQNVWAPLQDSAVIRRILDSIKGSDTFFNYCCTNQFKWINCDYFYSCGCPLTKISVKLPDGFGNINTQVMCVFKKIRSVTSLYGNLDNQLFETGGSYQAPIGSEVTLVVLTRKDGMNYMATKEVTLSLNKVHEIAPTEVTLAAMKTVIDGL